MWQTGDVIAWRGIFRDQVWHAIPVFVVKDTPQELVFAVLPGTQCKVEKDYNRGKKDGKRIWDFIDIDWELHDFIWHTHRLLIVLEPQKYYATELFWNQKGNQFVGYYINFQLPFRRNHCGFDTMDLELDIDINPDLSFKWKDLDDYQKGIETGIILPGWTNEIEIAKAEVLTRLGKRLYPFDGSWLDWMPDPAWSLPTLPQNWDNI